MSLIEVRHLREEYPNVTPLRDVNAHVDEGEVISIIGPSDTGKSTFIRCLNRLETPTSGSIIVDGQDMCAPDASSRVFYMDKGGLWEAGTPEQIFEYPERQETHDFVFRVRSWGWDVDSLAPDLPAMEASLEQYCTRQFMGRRAANACQLLVEEVVASQLLPVARARGVADPGIHITLSAGEGGVDMALAVDYRALLTALDGADLLDAAADELSAAIVRGLCERIERDEPGTARFVMR